MSLHIKSIDHFIFAVDFFSDEMEVEIAAGAHQLSQIGLLENATLNRQNIMR